MHATWYMYVTVVTQLTETLNLLLTVHCLHVHVCDYYVILHYAMEMASSLYGHA